MNRLRRQGPALRLELRHARERRLRREPERLRSLASTTDRLVFPDRAPREREPLHRLLVAEHALDAIELGRIHADRLRDLPPRALRRHHVRVVLLPPLRLQRRFLLGRGELRRFCARLGELLQSALVLRGKRVCLPLREPGFVRPCPEVVREVVVAIPDRNVGDLVLVGLFGPAEPRVDLRGRLGILLPLVLQPQQLALGHAAQLQQVPMRRDLRAQIVELLLPDPALQIRRQPFHPRRHSRCSTRTRLPLTGIYRRTRRCAAALLSCARTAGLLSHASASSSACACTIASICPGVRLMYWLMSSQTCRRPSKISSSSR